MVFRPMTQKTIAVFGATGSQGGAVVRYLRAQGVFHVRALTRQPDAYRVPADEAVHTIGQLAVGQLAGGQTHAG